MHDDWGIDVLVTASQKAWGAPPGVAMVTMSDKAWKAYEHSDLPKLYFDLQSYKSSLEKGATPATPAVTRPCPTPRRRCPSHPVSPLAAAIRETGLTVVANRRPS